MLALQDVPPPHALTTVALIGLALVLWVFARVQLLRRQLARGGTDQPGVTRLRFLHKLAAWPGTNGVLALAAIGCGARCSGSLCADRTPIQSGAWFDSISVGPTAARPFGRPTAT